MAFLDDLAIRLDRRAPATGAAPDLARGRKASRKVGMLMGVSITTAILGLAGCLACFAGLFSFTIGMIAAGALMMAASAGVEKLAVYSANKIFDRHGEHINAYLDPLYPDITGKRVQDLPPVAETFNTEADVTTDSPVTAMKPLKFQRKTAQQPGVQA
ncbi:MAG: hypothetical protein ACAH80_09240 [Alphaproteobacteria bacterium]